MNDLILLSCLLDGPKHGYALKKEAGLIVGRSAIHNNLVYPALRRFVESGWVSQRRAAGQRGQSREVYALSSKGKRELLRQLGEFTARQARAGDEFHLRVAMFGVLDEGARRRILAARESWLESRQSRLRKIQAAMKLRSWAGELVRFLLEQTAAEREWIANLETKARRNPDRKKAQTDD